MTTDTGLDIQERTDGRSSLGGAKQARYAVPATLAAASDERIAAAIADAHPPTLRGLLYLLTGDAELETIETTTGTGFLTANAMQIEGASDLAMLQCKGVALLRAYRDGHSVPPDPRTFPREHLLKAISLAVGMEVPPNEYEYWHEEFAFDPWARALEWDNKPVDKVKDFKVIVVGAGNGGINAAIQLKRAGFSFKVFERNSGVGGTWFENNYPGARVDLASRIYSHLFGVNYPWQHMFATSQENKGYTDWCVDSFGVRGDISFNTLVVSMRWEEASGEWVVKTRTTDGVEEEHRANGIISAGGLFDRPSFGDFKGVEDFKGLKMHTARYDKSIDLSEKRVAVIGTGASGIQMVPDLAKQVKSLTIFQRSPGWVLPIAGYRDELSDGLKWLDVNLPYYVNFSRVQTHWMAGDHDQWYAFTIDPDWKEEHSLNKETADLRRRCLAYMEEKLEGRPDLLEKSIPDYPPLTKRFILDNGWYDALKRDNVKLVAEAVDHIEADAIVTTTGRRVEVDAIIFATGYKPNAFLEPMVIEGRGGVTPQQIWAKDGARAFWGVTVPGLPNFFMIYGPGTNGKISGPVPWGEMQTRYAMGAFKALIENGKRYLDVKPSAYDGFNARLDEELTKTIWLDPRQKSYYTNEYGRSATNAPWKVSEMWQAWRRPNLDDYEVG